MLTRAVGTCRKLRLQSAFIKATNQLINCVISQLEFIIWKILGITFSYRCFYNALQIRTPDMTVGTNLFLKKFEAEV